LFPPPPPPPPPLPPPPRLPPPLPTPLPTPLLVLTTSSVSNVMLTCSHRNDDDDVLALKSRTPEM
jgi:hypothetical protein